MTKRPHPEHEWRRRLVDRPQDCDALAGVVAELYGRHRSGRIGPWVDRALAVGAPSLDPLWIDTVAAERGFSHGMAAAARALLGYPSTRPKNLILVNTFPRVPTLPLEAALIRLMRLRRGSLHVHGELRTPAFDPIQARRDLREGCLVRAHVSPSLRLRSAMVLLRLRPILMVRNLFDALASYVGDGYFIATGHRFDLLDDTAQRRTLLLRNASDMVDFYACWSVLAAANPNHLRVDVYEEIAGDWAGYTQRILAERGAEVGRDVVERAMQGLPPIPAPKPHGFTSEEQALVRELYAQYPSVDFSRIDPEYMR